MCLRVLPLQIKVDLDNGNSGGNTFSIPKEMNASLSDAVLNHIKTRHFLRGGEYYPAAGDKDRVL